MKPTKPITNLKTSLMLKLSNKTTELIHSFEYKNRSRKSKTDFIRTRKMPFEEAILFMIESLKCSTQSALRRFFDKLGKEQTMKQQSFSDVRQKINVSAFVELFKLSADVITQERNAKWNGYRVYAIDGSKITLPADKGLLSYYGGLGGGGISATAQGSVLYDVINDIVIAANIEPMSVDERTLAKAHIDECAKMFPDEKKLLILDRGYPSFEIMEKMESNDLFYLMRVRKKFNLDIDAQTTPDGYVELRKGGKTLRVRVIKLKLENGTEETLVTNIRDKRLGKAAFKKLYFMRWPVETKYDIVKNKIQVENFSSRTIEGVQQDFFAAMYLVNVAAAAAYDAQAEIDAARDGKDNKYKYKPNINELIGVLKDHLVIALTHTDQRKQAEAVMRIIDKISDAVVPIRLNRSVNRRSCTRKSKFHHNKKANC
jgi:hypothetical protein